MHHVVPNEGCDLHYWQRGSGRPVVFVHGAGADHSVFDHQFEAVAEAGFRAVSWDLRGHGLSRPATQPINPDSLLSDLSAVIADLAQTHRPVLVGHSLGSQLVQAYARRYPYRALVSIAGAFNEAPQSVGPRLLHGLTALSVRALPGRALVATSSRCGALLPASRTKLAATASRLEPAELRAALLAGHQFAVPDAHYRCVMPVCLVRGAHDRLGDKLSDAGLWAERQGVPDRVLTGAGHAVPLDDPAGLNAILLRFLAEL